MKVHKSAYSITFPFFFNQSDNWMIITVAKGIKDALRGGLLGLFLAIGRANTWVRPLHSDSGAILKFFFGHGLPFFYMSKNNFLSAWAVIQISPLMRYGHT